MWTVSQFLAIISVAGRCSAAVDIIRWFIEEEELVRGSLFKSKTKKASEAADQCFRSKKRFVDDDDDLLRLMKSVQGDGQCPASHHDNDSGVDDNDHKGGGNDDDDDALNC